MSVIGGMFSIGMKDMNQYYASVKKMNNKIIEYINGMEVVKVFNRGGESYKKYANSDIEYRDFTFAGEFRRGKSMLAKPLVHFYNLSAGEILIGGQDITK
ncbi:ABC transporter ATP-binding protein/permease [Clostridium cadaveris]|uniref:ABC transporter ATP-binding protein/permease n=1 Tax=Clostridium cadaveris TaxID=1529 RepID=UPI0015B75D48|nr:ABC transporter ATP-binding protein/permease [Clostridium cadaveris]NWK09936.1 ABC transporter ATP-binding protein/permease [Clostridium cadaveris]